MKKLLLLSSFVFAMVVSYSQTTTIILLRHAEKDTTAKGSTTMTADPPLSAEGKLRSERLPKILEAYKTDTIYSTNYTRTKQTVTPLATKFNKTIQLYDPRNLSNFSKELLQIKDKTIVVVGHSNTTPMLANLLIGESAYAAMDDNDYSKYWIVTVKDGKATAVIKQY
jgi:broad specificity phosphatase PhoE